MVIVLCDSLKHMTMSNWVGSGTREVAVQSEAAGATEEEIVITR